MKKKLSIIIPVYNEEVYIERCLDKVCDVVIPNWQKEIIVIDDGSTDSTTVLLKKYVQKRKEIQVIYSKTNRGKGSALKKGIVASSGDVLIIQDGDMEYDPNDYVKILSLYENEKVEVVYGSRILGNKYFHNNNASYIYLFGGLTLTRIVNLILGVKITDQPTCYKSWRKFLSHDLVRFCKGDGFDFEVEMTAFFSRKTKIAEVPIHYYPRTVNQGKKIKAKDFITSVIATVKSRFKKVDNLY